MAQIFISYRRTDTAAVAGRVHDHLKLRLGDEQVFKDVYSMAVGRDFRSHVQGVLDQSEVILAFIGNTWLATEDKDGNRRLDDPDDPVRQEIERALTQEIPVIPVLVENAQMPEAGELPRSLQPLIYLHATKLRDADFDYDFGRLCDAIMDICGDFDLRVGKRKKQWMGAILALGVLIVAAMFATVNLIDGDDLATQSELFELRQRMAAMETQNHALRSQLTAVGDAENPALLVPVLRNQLATSDPTTFSNDFRGEFDSVIQDSSLNEADKARRLTPIFTDEMRSLDEQIRAQAERINELERHASPGIDVETMKLKRLIDKRSQMFDMLRETIDQYNETAKGIINSMGR